MVEAPRVSPPDLPAQLARHVGLAARVELLGVRIDGLVGRVDAAHSTLMESLIAAASVDGLDLTGAVLRDVEVEHLQATQVHARSGRWRSVRVTGGRIGSLDLSGAEVESVELRDIRIDYLNLAGARVQDLLITDCVIKTLDLPMAALTRVRFEGCQADEVDTRELRAENLDLRGLEALSYTSPAGLRGATLTPAQVAQFAPAFAAALGIRIEN